MSRGAGSSFASAGATDGQATMGVAHRYTLLPPLKYDTNIRTQFWEKTASTPEWPGWGDFRHARDGAFSKQGCCTRRNDGYSASARQAYDALGWQQISPSHAKLLDLWISARLGINNIT